MELYSPSTGMNDVLKALPTRSFWSRRGFPGKMFMSRESERFHWEERRAWERERERDIAINSSQTDRRTDRLLTQHSSIQSLLVQEVGSRGIGRSSGSQFFTDCSLVPRCSLPVTSRTRAGRVALRQLSLTVTKCVWSRWVIVLSMCALIRTLCPSVRLCSYLSDCISAQRSNTGCSSSFRWRITGQNIERRRTTSCRNKGVQLHGQQKVANTKQGNQKTRVIPASIANTLHVNQIQVRLCLNTSLKILCLTTLPPTRQSFPFMLRILCSLWGRKSASVFYLPSIDRTNTTTRLSQDFRLFRSPSLRLNALKGQAPGHKDDTPLAIDSGISLPQQLQ